MKTYRLAFLLENQLIFVAGKIAYLCRNRINRIPKPHDKDK